MNSLICFCVIVTIWSCNNKNENFSGIVWIEYAIDSAGNTASQGDTIAYEYFNSKGILVKKITKNKTQLGVLEKTHLFDSMGREIGSVVKYGDNHTYNTKIIRDRSGYITKLKINENADEDTLSFIFLNKFSEDSSIVLSTAVNEIDSTPHFFYEDKYDLKKNIIQSIVKRKSEKDIVLESIENYKYDEKGKKIFLENKNFVDSIFLKAEFFYDSNGNLSREINIKNNTIIHEIDYIYKDNRKYKAIKTNFPEKRKTVIRFIHQKDF